MPKLCKICKYNKINILLWLLGQKYCRKCEKEMEEQEEKRRKKDLNNIKKKYKSRQEITNKLDILLGDIQAVWKLPDDDEWLKSVKEDFEDIKKLVNEMR